METKNKEAKFKLHGRYLLFSRMNKHDIFEGRVIEFSPSKDMVKFELDSKSNVWYGAEEVKIYEELNNDKNIPGRTDSTGIK